MQHFSIEKNGKVPAEFLKLDYAISLARLTAGRRVYSDFHPSLGQSLLIVKSSLYQDSILHWCYHRQLLLLRMGTLRVALGLTVNYCQSIMTILYYMDGRVT